jgi:hypothetical protein
MEAQPSDLIAAPPPPGPTNPLKLIWSALWFQEAAYAELRDSANPILRGLVVVLIASIIAGVTATLGLGFDRLTSASLQDIRRVVLDGVQHMLWYRQFANGPGGADFRRFFMDEYNLWWTIGPALIGLPTLANALITLFGTPIFGVLTWLVAGAFTYLAARALGGQGGFGPTMGVMALASAPQLLTVLTIVPGLQVAGLAGWWTIALSYWAVRSAHRLPWYRNLLAIILPRVVLVVLIILLLIVAVGLAGALASVEPS